MHGFSYANYLAELGPDVQDTIFQKSSVDLAMRDAYHKMRHFLMTTQNLSEDEAISLMSIAVDFGITQVVDGNWGVHAIVKKSISPDLGARPSRPHQPRGRDARAPGTRGARSMNPALGRPATKCRGLGRPVPPNRATGRPDRPNNPMPIPQARAHRP